MLIKELHSDVERYLLNDCYCPHEIYSFDGFFYQLFDENQECEKLGEFSGSFVACVSFPNNDSKTNGQVVLFFLDKDKVCDALRYDATENNLELTKLMCMHGTAFIKNSGKKFNEYSPGSTAKSLSQILAISDAIMIN